MTSIVSSSADADVDIGVTKIIGPDGKPFAKALSSRDEIVRAKIPLAAQRDKHILPNQLMEKRPVSLDV